MCVLRRKDEAFRPKSTVPTILVFFLKVIKNINCTISPQWKKNSPSIWTDLFSARSRLPLQSRPPFTWPPPLTLLEGVYQDAVPSQLISGSYVSLGARHALDTSSQSLPWDLNAWTSSSVTFQCGRAAAPLQAPLKWPSSSVYMKAEALLCHDSWTRLWDIWSPPLGVVIYSCARVGWAGKTLPRLLMFD